MARRGSGRRVAMPPVDIECWESYDYSDPADYLPDDPIRPMVRVNYRDLATPLGEWVDNIVAATLALPTGRRGWWMFGFAWEELGAYDPDFDILGAISGTVIPDTAALEARNAALSAACRAAGIEGANGLNFIEFDTEIPWDNLTPQEQEAIFERFPDELAPYTYADLWAPGGVESVVNNSAHAALRRLINTRVFRHIRRLIALANFPLAPGGTLQDWLLYAASPGRPIVSRSTLRGGPTRFRLSNGLVVPQLYHRPIFNNGQASGGGGTLDGTQSPALYIRTPWMPGATHHERCFNSIALLLNELELCQMEAPPGPPLCPWVPSPMYAELHGVGEVRDPSMYPYNRVLLLHAIARGYLRHRCAFWNSVNDALDTLSRQMMRQILADARAMGLDQWPKPRRRYPMMNVGVTTSIVSPGITTYIGDTFQHWES